MRDKNGNIPEGHWHLSDAHGMVVMFGPDRWLEPTKAEQSEYGANRWTHAELSRLIDHLNTTGFTMEVT